jgi:hypothetical protein
LRAGLRGSRRDGDRGRATYSTIGGDVAGAARALREHDVACRHDVLGAILAATPRRRPPARVSRTVDRGRRGWLADYEPVRRERDTVLEGRPKGPGFSSSSEALTMIFPIISSRAARFLSSRPAQLIHGPSVWSHRLRAVALVRYLALVAARPPRHLRALQKRRLLAWSYDRDDLLEPSHEPRLAMVLGTHLLQDTLPD